MSSPPDQNNAKDPGGYGVERTGQTRRDQALVAEIQQRLDKASTIQEQLAESREELLIQREKYRSSGKLLRDQRVKASDAEAAFMDALRPFFNEYRDTLSLALASAYEDVVTTRDKLGAMEADYLQNDRILSGLEWTYTDKENDVYQADLRAVFSDLFKNIVTPPATQPHIPSIPPSSLTPSEGPASPSVIAREYHTAKAELDESRRQFNKLRMEKAEVFDIESLPNESNVEVEEDTTPDTDFRNRYFPVLKRMITCEVRFQPLKTRYENMVSMSERRMSDPAHCKPVTAFPKTFDNVTRAQTETAVPTLCENPSTLHKISEWLLDCLKSNAIQWTIYFSILEKFGIVERENVLWDDHTPQYWSKDSDEHSRTREQKNSSSTNHTSERLAINEGSKLDAKAGSDKPSPDRSMPLTRTGINSDAESEPASPLGDKNKISDLLGLLTPPISRPHSEARPPVMMKSDLGTVPHENSVPTIDDAPSEQEGPAHPNNLKEYTFQGSVTSEHTHDDYDTHGPPEREMATSHVQINGDTAQNLLQGWDNLSPFANGTTLCASKDRCHSAPIYMDSSAGSLHRTVTGTKYAEISGSAHVQPIEELGQEDQRTAGPLQSDQGETHLVPRNTSSTLLQVDSGFFSASGTDCGCSTGNHWPSRLRKSASGSERRTSSMSATLCIRYTPYTSEQQEQDAQLRDTFKNFDFNIR